MTLQTLPSIMCWPYLGAFSAAPAFGTGGTLVASGDYFAIVMVAREAMTISHVAFRVNATAGSPTATIGIYTVDASGIPTTTPFTASSELTGQSPAANAVGLYALAAPAVISQGNIFAVKLTFNSGTSLIVANGASIQYNAGIPYQVVGLTGGTVPTKTTTQAQSVALGSSSTTFYSPPLPGCIPPNANFSTNSVNNASGQPTQGMRFQIPFKARCVGLRVYQGTTTGNFTAGLYDDPGAVRLAFRDMIGLQASNAASSNIYAYFNAGVILLPSTWYRAAISAVTATNISMFSMLLPNVNYMSGLPGGPNYFYTTAPSTTPAGATWVDTATSTLPMMDLLFDQLGDDTSGHSDMMRMGIEAIMHANVPDELIRIKSRIIRP